MKHHRYFGLGVPGTPPFPGHFEARGGEGLPYPVFGTDHDPSEFAGSTLALTIGRRIQGCYALRVNCEVADLLSTGGWVDG